MKQWPERHVRALIQLLIEQDGVAVLLVGGTDDFAIAASIMQQIDRPDVIGSVAGLTALRDMPRLLAACTLFIGCDSGPKHIAAASGVATIGIHSGIVDPAEWGPMGERAVALYRDMSCAPCFLAKPEHCPRGLACIEMLDPVLVWQMARRFLGRPVNERIAPVRRVIAAPDPVIVAVLPPAQPRLFQVAEETAAPGSPSVEPPSTASTKAATAAGKSAKRLTKSLPPVVAKAVVLTKRTAKSTPQVAARTALAAKSRRRAQRSPAAGPK
jgi:hypothetical protein